MNTDALSRSRVKGFLGTDGRKLVNGDGEEVQLLGWGLGNWLLCEGYMWNAGDIDGFDRPRRMEKLLAEIAGEDWAGRFWETFRDRYIAEEDFRLMARMGCNSVRIPVNAALFMHKGPGCAFREEGFALLDRAVDRCEKAGLYAFIDLHGAPGGQTGANIDDSEADDCRLFADPSEYARGIALWREIARRYKDRRIVGGYDLLNEPIRPVRWEGDTDLGRYLPRLRSFYTDCIAAIRAEDPVHIVALEGHHWASDPEIFDHVYDDRMVIHFHRYACAPDIRAYEKFTALSDKLNVPLWLGETGENSMEWFSAMYPLCLDLGISLTLWPWKKMECLNSPCSVKAPEDWDLFLDVLRGKRRADREEIRRILEDYLEKIRAEHCRINENIPANILRTPGCTVSGSAFDEFPGADASYHCERFHDSPVDYRRDTGMHLAEAFPERGKRFAFDGDWARYTLCLHPDEWACYTFRGIREGTCLCVSCRNPEENGFAAEQDGRPLVCCGTEALNGSEILFSFPLEKADLSVIRITGIRDGTVLTELSIR